MVNSPIKDEKGNLVDADGNIVDDPDDAATEKVWTGNYLVEITGPGGQAEATGFPEGYTAKMNKDNLVTISGSNGFEMTLDLFRLNQNINPDDPLKANPKLNVQKKFEDLGMGDPNDPNDPAEILVYTPQDENGNASSLRIEATGVGAMRLQVGSNEGQVLPVEIPAISLRNDQGIIISFF